MNGVKYGATSVEQHSNVVLVSSPYGYSTGFLVLTSCLDLYTEGSSHAGMLYLFRVSLLSAHFDGPAY